MSEGSRRLLALARPELAPLALGTVALTINAGMNLAYPLVVRIIVDNIDEGGGREVVDHWALVLLGLFAVGALFGAVRAYLFTVAGERVVARLRKNLYESIIRQEIAFFDERRTGELTNRLAADTTVLQNTVTVNVSMALRYAIMAIGAVGFLFYTSWRLTLLTLAIVPLVAIGGGLYGQSLRKLSRRVQDALAQATEVAEETLSGIRTVRCFAREAHESRRYGRSVDRSFDLARTRARVIASFRGVVGFSGYAVVAVVLWYGSLLLLDGVLTMGQLTAFLLYTLTVAFSLGALSSLYEDFMKALGASERVFDLLERETFLPSGERTLADLEGAVSFQRVGFAYPSRPEAPVLAELDLELRPGRVVALVGPSGGGKSTVAALMSRLYDPQVGRICLDGVPLTELDADWLRAQVGVVSQEPILFATTIEENIRYGLPGAPDEEVERAARAANAHEFVAGFPETYSTRVGERGVKLSGGQKQRVAIARALLKDPVVLVLDEATSALDAESEHLVQEALDRLMQGRTTLVIAHRLSTVRAADLVVVLDEGRVAEQGTHDELVERDGLYRRLLERQFSAA
ncbi:MAG: ABC transporter transmembrane domain-containing protein [Myxococcota bacterium]|nr:ABC transporter transmembrane domain-containing protein [Myxococcota bacterium]